MRDNVKQALPRNTNTAETRRRSASFTGWHMLATMVGFFTVIIVVNFYMAAQAMGTFSGTTVPNSYVASQHFNQWLAEGRRQEALGWQVTLDRTTDGKVDVTISDATGAPLSGISLAGRADHPLGQAAPQRLHFVERSGRWLSTSDLPPGRWTVHLRASRGDDHVDITEPLP